MSNALHALLYVSRQRAPNPLDNLLLVDEAIRAASFPQTNLIRAHVLSDILMAMIREELVRHRCALGLQDGDAEASQQDALEAIERDGQTLCSELVAWSWLYHRFVRPELNISGQLFSRAARIHDRTLARYRAWAIRRLTLRLIEQEVCARKVHQKRLLFAQLPAPGRTPFYGRAESLRKVLEWSNSSHPRHVQVVGTAGIGKTAFVRNVVSSLIDAEVLDCLIWVDAPRSLGAIYERLTDAVRGYGIECSIPEFVQCRRVALVLDGAEPLCHDLGRLQGLLNQLRSAHVYLTTRVLLPVNPVGHVVLHGLPYLDASRMIRGLLNNWHIQGREPATADTVDYVWKEVGGHPQAIEQIVFQMQAHRERLDVVYPTASAARTGLRPSASQSSSSPTLHW